jgi:hypothetical protein
MNTHKFSVTIAGFKNKEDALTFLEWYEGSGEQSFDDWVACEDPHDIPTNVDVSYKGNTGSYYDEILSNDGSMNFTAYVK